MDKQKLRKEVSKRVAQLTYKERLSVAEKISELISAIKQFIKAKVIMVYLAKEDEVDTTGIIQQAQKQGKTVVVPVIEKGEILPCRLEGELRVGSFGIKEPRDRKLVGIEEIDMVIVPGRAFDHQGVRLGRGGGYYDRFLSKLPQHTYKVGICFSCQVFDYVPSGPSDVKVDLVVSA